MRKKGAMSYRRASTLLLCAVLVAACAPVIKQYHEPSLKGAKLKYDIHWKQPRLEANLSHGATLSVSGSYEQSESGRHKLWFEVWYVVPKSNTLNLLSNEILLEGPNGYSKQIQIDSLMGQGPKQINQLYQPTDALVGESLPCKFQPLFGSECIYDNYYIFYYSESTPAFFEHFSIKLPPVSVNGQRVEAKTIRFRRTSSVSIETI